MKNKIALGLGLLMCLMSFLAFVPPFSLPRLVASALASSHFIENVLFRFFATLYITACCIGGMSIILNRPWPRLLGSSWLRDSLAGVGVGLLTATCVIVPDVWLWQVQIAPPANTERLIVAVASGSFAAAVSEEIMLRGVAQHFLLKRFSLGTCALVQGVIFTLLHANYLHMPLMPLKYFLSGVVLSLAAASFPTLWAAIAIHFSLNLIFGLAYGMPFGGERITGIFSEGTTPTTVITEAVLLCVLLVYFRYRLGESVLLSRRGSSTDIFDKNEKRAG